MRLIDIKRTGTQHIRPELNWTGGRPTPQTGGQWFCIYSVTTSTPDGLVSSYDVGVVAKLFSFAE